MKTTTPTDTYDKRACFEAECRPLLDELILACSLRKIPCFFTACVENTPDSSDYIHVEDEGSARYINDAVGTGSRSINLTDNQIVKHLCVVRGFDVVPSRTALEVDMEEIVNEEVWPDVDEEVWLDDDEE